MSAVPDTGPRVQSRLESAEGMIGSLIERVERLEAEARRTEEALSALEGESAPEPVAEPEGEGLKVVPFAVWDSRERTVKLVGNPPYREGYERLVRLPQATAMLAEKDAEIERLRRELRETAEDRRDADRCRVMALRERDQARAMLDAKDAEIERRGRLLEGAEEEYQEARARITELEAREVTEDVVRGALESWMKFRAHADFVRAVTNHINRSIRSNPEEATDGE